MNITCMIKTALSGALIFLTAFLGNCWVEDASAWELAGKSFRSKDLEVKMLEKGTVEIYDGAGQLLAVSESFSGDWQNLALSNAVWSVDTNRTIILTMQAKDFAGNYVKKMRAVENGIEITTEFPWRFMTRMRCDWGVGGYDGGRWQSDSGDGGAMVARTNELPRGQQTLFKLDSASYTLTEAASCARLSFWRKDSELGFSVENIKKNRMTLSDWGKADKNGNPQVSYVVFMNANRTGEKWSVTELIAPARRSPQDIKAHCIESKTQISAPQLAERYGYIPAGYALQVEAVIQPSKETAGDYIAQYLVLDQTNNVILRQEKDLTVTESSEGKTKFEVTAPDRCNLYWLRINILGKQDGKSYFSREYPFAVIVKLPEPKDIPATSPLGGQPLAGGLMPEGRLVGMKWDRFWALETSWDTIEPEKGKFNWKGADRMVEEAVKNGNEILWCLCRTPNWASKLPQEKIYDAIAAQYPVSPELKRYLKSSGGKNISMYSPPRDIKDWEVFVRAILRRYKDRVHYWQIWNEPWWDRKTIGNPVGGSLLVLYDENRMLKYKENGTVVKAEVWGFGGSIEDYANLVKSASRIIHEEDPQGKVVAYGDYWVRDENSSDEFYKTGVGDYIDVLAIHYFYYDYVYIKHKILNQGWPTYGKQAITPMDNIIHDFDRRYSKYTDKHVPVWNTEEGSASCSQGGRNTPRPLTQAECEKLYGKKAIIPEFFVCMMSERRNACWEIQSLLFSLGIGMDKVFLHSGRSISVPSMGKVDYKLPTEKGIAWAAMASVVNTRKSVQYSPMGNQELDAVTITDISGKKTAVVWSHTGERKIPVRIPVGKNKKFKGMDFLGNPVALQSKNGWLTIDVCEEPFYIHDLDLGGIFTSDRSFLSIKGEKDIEVMEVGKPYCREIVVSNPYTGHSIDGVLEASVKPDGKIAVEGKVKLAPGEQKTVPFNIMAGKEESRVEFVLKEQEAELERVEKTYLIARYQKGTPLPKCPRAIKVDGEAGDWEGIVEHKVDTADRVLVGLEMPRYEQAPIRIWKGAEDLSFTVKTCWREDGLYFLVDVKDNETNPGPEPSCQWDCVEFFVDARDAAGQAKREKTPGAGQFSVQPSLGDVPQECKIVFAGNDGKYAKVFFTGRKTKTGYMVEGRVEPSGIQLKEGMMIGLDVAVDDGREPNPENKEERKSQMVWLGTQDNYKDTSKWGKFYLAK